MKTDNHVFTRRGNNAVVVLPGYRRSPDELERAELRQPCCRRLRRDHPAGHAHHGPELAAI